MADTVLPAEILVRREVSEEQQGLLAAHLAGCGFPARVRRVRDHRGAEELSWIVLIALPLQAFLSGLGSEAVGDAYRGLKRLVAGRGERRQEEGVAVGSGVGPRSVTDAPGAPGPVETLLVPLVLQDSNSGIQIVLEAGLPQQAFAQLVALDLTAYRWGPIHYDLAQERWRSVRDEVAGTVDETG